MDLFGDHEKRYLLGEMLKSSHIDPQEVIDFINRSHISPNWLEMQLPRGRTMSDCFEAAQRMGISTPPPPILSQPSQFREYGSQLSAQQLPQHPMQHPVQHQAHQQQHRDEMPQSALNSQPQRAQGPPVPLPKPPSLSTGKRRLSTDSSYAESASKRIAPNEAMYHNLAPHPRNIQPRPASNSSANPTHMPLTASLATPATGQKPLPKKRGRPSRADKNAEARAAGIGYSLPHLAPASARPVPISPPGVPMQDRHDAHSRGTSEDQKLNPILHTGHTQTLRPTGHTGQTPEPFQDAQARAAENETPRVPPPIPSKSGLRSLRPSPHESESSPEQGATPNEAHTAPPNAQPSSHLSVSDLIKNSASTATTTRA